MLTKKQYELLMFIHQRVRETGVPPSFDEMKDALDLRSKSGIHRLITALEERGYIRRLEKRARALEIIRLPENSAKACVRQRRATRRNGSPGLSRMRADHVARAAIIAWKEESLPIRVRPRVISAEVGMTARTS